MVASSSRTRRPPHPTSPKHPALCNCPFGVPPSPPPPPRSPDPQPPSPGGPQPGALSLAPRPGPKHLASWEKSKGMWADGPETGPPPLPRQHTEPHCVPPSRPPCPSAEGPGLGRREPDALAVPSPGIPHPLFASHKAALVPRPRGPPCLSPAGPLSTSPVRPTQESLKRKHLGHRKRSPCPHTHPQTHLLLSQGRRGAEPSLQEAHLGALPQGAGLWPCLCSRIALLPQWDDPGSRRLFLNALSPNTLALNPGGIAGGPGLRGAGGSESPLGHLADLALKSCLLPLPSLPFSNGAHQAQSRGGAEGRSSRGGLGSEEAGQSVNTPLPSVSLTRTSAP